MTRPEIYLTGSKYVVFDFETTVLDKGSALNYDNHIVLACWSTVDRSARTIVRKYRFGDEFELQELADDIASADFIVAQNAKFEMQWLKRMGLELRDILCYCTMLGAWVLDGNLRKPRNLNALAARYKLGTKEDRVTKLIESGMCCTEIPQSWLLTYCNRDVELTRKIFTRQLKEIVDRQQEHIIHVRNMTCAVLADIEFNGMELDEEQVDAEYTRVTKRLDELETELKEFTGGINLGSPKQLREYLFNVLKFDYPKDNRGNRLETDSGEVSTNAAAMSGLTCKTEDQRYFVDKYKEFNKLDALLTKNLEFFKKVCDEHKGKFYGSLNQGITATHRLASSGRPLLFKGAKKTKSVQFQNMPREYKRLFTAREAGYVIAECDGAQLEFRVAGDLGRDRVAYEDITGKVDVHSYTAKVLTDAGEPTSRQDAKRMTFKPLFGGQSGTKAEVEYIKFFTNKYDGIAQTQRTWALTVLDQKYLRTPHGMMFFWPDTKMTRSGYIVNTTSIYNYPIQNLATAEIIPIALIYFWHRSRGMKLNILNTIHDSIIAKVHEDSVYLFNELAKQCLTTDVFNYLSKVYGYDFQIPLGVGIKCDKHWGQGKEELIYDVWPDGHFTETRK